MRFGRAATVLSESVSDLTPEAKETMQSVRNAADMVYIVAAIAAASLLLVVARQIIRSY